MDALELHLNSLGYAVDRRVQERFRGGGNKLMLVARCGDQEYFIYTDRLDLYPKIKRIQCSIPRMAKIALLTDEVTLVERAHGELLWHLETLPDPKVIEDQLIEFATAAARNGLVHGDIRPWNICWDENRGVTVFDWSLADFFGDIVLNTKASRTHHYRAGKKDIKINQIDIEDARRISRLIRGEITIQDMGHGEMRGCPSWCRNEWYPN